MHLLSSIVQPDNDQLYIGNMIYLNTSNSISRYNYHLDAWSSHFNNILTSDVFPVGVLFIVLGVL